MQLTSRHLSFALLTSLCGAALAAQPPAAAAQASYTPQAYLAQRSHQGVDVFAVGAGPERAYVFTPAQPSPQGAPLVFFHHGWLGMNPLNFGGLIDLLVRRGAVVVYPVYQDGDHTSPQAVTKLAQDADLAALRALRSRYPGMADEGKTMYIGYSMGAAISLNLALAPALLPAPRALLLMAPGDAYHVAHGADGKSIYGDVESLPASLPTVLVSGLADTSIGVPTARKLAARLCHLQHRNLILFPSDTDGERTIVAGHGSPGAPDQRYNFPYPRTPLADGAHIAPRSDFEPSGSLNLLDFYGYWRLATRLLDYVDGQALPADIFGASEANGYLGKWPSGKEYAKAQIENPCPQ
ncbi:dienelactone hydrolase [Oxalobacteraceae bacterium GrIS 1.11]